MASSSKARPWIPVAVVLALVASGGGGCGEIDGSQTQYPGTVRYLSPGGGYHFHYLAPPWVLVASSGDVLDMIVPDSFTAIPRSTADVLYHLRIEPQAAAALAAAVSRSQTLARDANAIVTAVRPVVVDGELARTEVLWRERSTDVLHRDAFLAGALPDESFRMSFSARVTLDDDPMISQMIASFGAEPAGGTRP